MTSVDGVKVHFSPTMVLHKEWMKIPQNRKNVKLKRLKDVNLQETNRRIKELMKVYCIKFYCIKNLDIFSREWLEKIVDCRRERPYLNLYKINSYI